MTRWVVRAGIALVAVLFVGALSLVILNGTLSEDPTTLLTIAVVGTYAAVGGLLAIRLPRNPIGWLFLSTGLGVLLGGAGNAIVGQVAEGDVGRVEGVRGRLDAQWNAPRERKEFLASLRKRTMRTR